MKIVAVVPARLASTRLPRKMLREIAGKPLLAWVYEAARNAPGLDEVIVATDSKEIVELCRKQGFTARMTSDRHRSGTDRVHEISQQVAADVYMNIQGDEPLAQPEQIGRLAELMRRPDVAAGTLYTSCSAQDIGNPNAVKMVVNKDGRALYFSRAAIPFDRDKTGLVQYKKHLGFYAYRKAALDAFVRLPESKLEGHERLEQLRFLENGIDIHAAETPFDSIGVDTEEDLRRVEAILLGRNKNPREP